MFIFYCLTSSKAERLIGGKIAILFRVVKAKHNVLISCAVLGDRQIIPLIADEESLDVL